LLSYTFQHHGGPIYIKLSESCPHCSICLRINCAVHAQIIFVTIQIYKLIKLLLYIMDLIKTFIVISKCKIIIRTISDGQTKT
jgi:hypothetical protein